MCAISLGFIYPKGGFINKIKDKITSQPKIFIDKLNNFPTQNTHTYTCTYTHKASTK